MWFLNLWPKGYMFSVGFPVFTTCGAPQRECTLVQPSNTPTVCSPMEFKPHDPPILWKEAGIIYPPKGGGWWGLWGFVKYLVSLWASCEHVFRYMVFQWTRFHHNFGIRMGPYFIAWSPPPPPPPPHTHTHKHFQRRPNPPPPPPGHYFFFETWWHGTTFHITDPLYGESSGHRWNIFLTKGQLWGTYMFPLWRGWTSY